MPPRDFAKKSSIEKHHLVRSPEQYVSQTLPASAGTSKAHARVDVSASGGKNDVAHILFNSPV